MDASGVDFSPVVELSSVGVFGIPPLANKVEQPLKIFLVHECNPVEREIG